MKNYFHPLMDNNIDKDIKNVILFENKKKFYTIKSGKQI